MQKKLLITLPTIILIIILTLTVHVPFVKASPVIFNMDTLPENQGWTITKYGNATSYVSNGILTIEDNGGFLHYRAPTDWENTVDDTKGWIVEFRLKLEHSNISSQIPLISITIKQFFAHSILLYENGITVSDFGANTPTFQYLMNTTDNFHVYRLIGQRELLRIFVDEELVLDVPSSNFVAGSAIMYIEGQRAYTKSYWDYFSYDTNPNLTLTPPTLTVVDGISSYYISNLTGVTLDNPIIVIPNGVYAGWCVDKSVTMIRNETHNVILYSTVNSTLPYGLLFNWNAVNYILNHKQGNMQQIQDAIWYFVPDRVSPSLNETITWNMINAANANSNYVPSKGEIMAIIAFSGYEIGASTSNRSGVQTTILEYRIP